MSHPLCSPEEAKKELISNSCDAIEQLLIAMLDSGSITDANAEAIMEQVELIREEIE